MRLTPILDCSSVGACARLVLDWCSIVLRLSFDCWPLLFHNSLAYAALDQIQSELSRAQQPLWLIVGGDTVTEVVGRLVLEPAEPDGRAAGAGGWSGIQPVHAARAAPLSRRPGCGVPWAGLCRFADAPLSPRDSPHLRKPLGRVRENSATKISCPALVSCMARLDVAKERQRNPKAARAERGQR